MRVGIIGLLHESNTFIATPTTIESFREGVLATGGDVRAAFAGGHHEISGFFDQLDATAGIETIPIFAARATPSGVIAAATADELLVRMRDAFEAAHKLDGLLLAPHGAAVSERWPDFDGHWLSLVRQWVGRDVPLIATLDPHANLSQKMVDATDALIAYRTNPHIDQHARGVEAARLLIRALRGEVRPTQAAAMPPVSINIERQNPAAPPCKPLYDRADAMLQQPGVLSNSIVLGFPYADVAEMGTSFVVVTDNDRHAAQRLADELAADLVARREHFAGQFTSIDDAIAQAERSPGPVLLLDMGDNLGGGSPGDGTLLAASLASRRIPCFVCIYDPEAVERCARGETKLRVGGRHNSSLGAPLDVGATSIALHDGRFTEPQPRHGGSTRFDMGRTAVVRTESGLTLMLTSRRVMPASLQQLISCGLDPSSFHVIVAKGVHAPVAAYAPVCPTIIRVNTPGPTCADMRGFTYGNRRRPLFPFEPID
jgi:microcystin degradation protein MlrC